MQSWRSVSNPVICKAPKPSNIKGGSWDFAIVAPSSDRSTQVCGALLMTGKPFACLVPHDLINYIATVTRELAAATVAPG